MFTSFTVRTAIAACAVALVLWAVPKSVPKDDLREQLKQLRQEVTALNRINHDEIATRVAATLKPTLSPGSCATDDLEQKLRRLSAYASEVEAAIARADRRLSQ